MKLAFIGTGYVGLVTGVMMSHLGHEVHCIDVDAAKVNMLNQLEAPIYEPGLDDYIKQYGVTDRLNFILGFDKTLKGLDAIFITVGTPPKEDGDADLSIIYSALDNISKIVDEDTLLIVKSTVPPGTSDKIINYLRAKGLGYEVATNPEFLREGSAIEDFIAPDRIVVGAESDSARKKLEKIYKPLTDKGINLVVTDLITSELIKYASNTFLANKIAFINEMADLCEVVGGNINDLSHAVGLDRRIGRDFLKAGPGFGGSCFPKDIMALQHLTKNIGMDSLIVDAIIQANVNRPLKMLDKIKNIVGPLKGKNLAILGLTYKAGTDDLRCSPAIDLITLLKEEGANLLAYDPMGNKHAANYFDNLAVADTAIDACKAAEAIIVLTEWPEFKQINFDELKRVVTTPVIIDLRNFMDSAKMKIAGFKYYTVGQKHDF